MKNGFDTFERRYKIYVDWGSLALPILISYCPLRYKDGDPLGQRRFVKVQMGPVVFVIVWIERYGSGGLCK